MTEDRTGRELEPRPEEPGGAVAPREPALPQPSTSAAERFHAGDQAHTVGLTEERAAQIVRQSSNARMISFLGALILVLFIPLYWLYDIGLPILGVEGRLPKEADAQYVTDVKRGYALYLANCARCHSSAQDPGDGRGGIGPPLNDQGKLYNTLTDQGLPSTGHLNPNYLHAVLREGGRIVCGDPNSVMPAWEEPNGPLNYREVEEIIDFLLASNELTISYQPSHAEAGATIPPPVQVSGWRDPDYSPPPDATPVPACWSAPATSGPGATPAPVESPGTPESPRVVEVHAAQNALQWVDPETGGQLAAITVVEGETIEFHIVNPSATPHNFHIGSQADLSTAPENTDLPGVDTFTDGEQVFTYTVENVPDQPEFACTVLGHYQSMNGDLLVVPADGTTQSPSPGATGSPSTQSIPPGESLPPGTPESPAPSP